MGPAHAELMSVGPGEVVVTFTTAADERVTTRVGDHETTTTGPRHVARVVDLEPATTYALTVEGAPPRGFLPAQVRTLDRPPGRLLATVATANDVHFGETRCGITGFGEIDAAGPIFTVAPGEPPYPEVMSGAAITEMRALAPDAVVVKGDLTDRGTEEEYAAFLAAYGVFGDDLFHVRGNHDAMTSPTMAIEDTPYAVDLPGVTLAVLDTVIPGTDSGQLRADQVQWLDDLAREVSGPIIVFGHHHCWNVDSEEANTKRDQAYFGIQPDDSRALVATFAHHENLVGYFAGHTHTNRVRRFAATGTRPFAEVGCTKDYPGAWAEYRVYEGVHAGGPSGHRPRRVRLGRADAPHDRRRVRHSRPRRSRASLLHAAVLMQALEGLRVVDMATVFAGPGAAKYLADFGAEVVKVESPSGDGTRDMGWRDPDDGLSYAWKVLGRGKRAVVLDLKTDAGLRAMRRLVDTADVLIENLRPGTIERLGLDPGDLLARNPGLVVLRVTGFGQSGPYASRPGFATMAEAMGGFAAINGEPDGPPLLPPIALTDEVTALVGAFAVLAAVHHRDRTGEGQIVDVNLLESMLQLMGPLPSVWAELGELQERLGSGIPYTVPRGTYQCRDGVWVAVSTSAESVAQRLLRLLGAAEDPRFVDFAGRVAHRAELDQLLGDWIGARDSTDVLAAFAAADAAIAPVYTMEQLLGDPHVLARDAVVEVDGVRMPGPVARLSRTPGRIRHAGRPLGADTDDLLAAIDDPDGPWSPRPGAETSARDRSEVGRPARDASRGGTA
jgi:crotonobetainyl-CoA:carnitine CoA-transferase CaiB-like acyl-CoA transferase/predicted phosphodiesterase